LIVCITRNAVTFLDLVEVVSRFLRFIHFYDSIKTAAFQVFFPKKEIPLSFFDRFFLRQAAKNKIKNIA
jgi:hypothetical protein